MSDGLGSDGTQSRRLWDWTLATYARPGVQEATLALQDDHGLNTSLLLWAAFANPDREMMANGVQAAVAWDETVLWPLRNVRRALKAVRPPFSDVAREGLREDVKAAELRAERVLMEALEDLAGKADERDVPGALTRACWAWNSAPPPEALARLAKAMA